MNKRHAHHLWTKIRRVKPVYFFVVAVLSTIICIFALRSNNEQMLKLRTAVYAADKSNGNVELALQKLQSYVTSHMNTNLDSGNGSVYPPIQLQYTYQRALQAQKQATTLNNSQLYTEAQNYCQQQDSSDFSGRNRVPCIEQYVESHGASAPTIPSSLYEFSFISPTWSPDLAGWSMVVAVISGILFVIIFGTSRWLKQYVK
jgi:hypothetical protein